jgi:glycosyltransferase involved in cell wall biosynthesis
MRIALYNLTTTTAYGGVESFVWDLATQLTKRGHAVTIFGGRGNRHEASPGVTVRTFPFISRSAFAWIPGLSRAYAERKLLERLSYAVCALPALIAGRYDIIHIQKPYDMLPALLAARLTGARVVLGCHGEDFYRGDRWLATHMDAAVSCSTFNAQTVEARYHIPLRVVYNGIDTTVFHPPTQPTVLPQHPFRLLFVGRLQEWKGVETILQSLALLTDVTLTIAGDGNDRQRLEALVVALNITNRVTFLGGVPRTELPAIMATHHALVAASYASETFGIGLVEAQSCGLPVIASRFGGFVEVVSEGQTGLFYPPRDANALATCIATLQQAPEMRDQMAANAPAWAAQFAWPAVTDRVETVYQLIQGT